MAFDSEALAVNISWIAEILSHHKNTSVLCIHILLSI